MTTSVSISFSGNFPVVAELRERNGGVSSSQVRPAPSGGFSFGIHAGQSISIREVHEGDAQAPGTGSLEDKARRMWAAYSEKAGGKTFDGKPLPTWAELGEERQGCWLAAAAAA